MAAVTTVAQLCAKIETVAERVDTVAERLSGEIREVNARLRLGKPAVERPA